MAGPTAGRPLLRLTLDVIAAASDSLINVATAVGDNAPPASGQVVVPFASGIPVLGPVGLFVLIILMLGLTAMRSVSARRNGI